MRSSVIDKYCTAFFSLKRGSSKFGMAPHKPVLLLAFIEMVEKAIVIYNRIKVDAELVATFGARQAFSKFLSSGSFTADQIKFLDTIISYLAKNGTIDKSMLVEPPFNGRHEQGIFEFLKMKGRSLK